MSSRIVSSKTFHHRPGHVRMIQTVLGLGPKLSLDKDLLIRMARKRTGKNDFGSGYWEEPLEILLRAIEEEAHLNPLGRFMVREQLVSRLEVRLRAEDWFKKHPEILSRELYPVWLIAGLQRTGTTKLQRLLSTDRASRSLFSWESMFPAPLSENWQEKDGRILKTKRAEGAMRFLAPDFFAIHPVEHLEPEEDVLLLDVTFMSTSWEAMLHVPSYAQWLEAADPTPAYAYEAQLLKLLQWQRPGRRWILKSPHHLEWLDVVHRVYPEVQIIWPHRPVEKCIPSFMSMCAHGRSIFGTSVDAEQVGRHWLRKNSLMLEKAIEFRRQTPNARITDIFYRQLVEDPISQVERIYKDADLSLDEGLKRRFIDAESQSNPYRYGRHQYRVEDFGLNLEDIRKEVLTYSQFLNDPLATR